MIHCKECVYWAGTFKYIYDAPRGRGCMCSRLGFEGQEEFNAGDSDDALVMDADDAGAVYFITGANFGCVHGKAFEMDERVTLAEKGECDAVSEAGNSDIDIG